MATDDCATETQDEETTRPKPGPKLPRGTYTFYVFPLYVLTWLLIISGFLIAPLNWLMPSIVTEEDIFYAFWGVNLFTLIAMGMNFDRTVSLVLLLIAMLIGVLSLYLGSRFNIPIFGPLFRFIHATHPRMSSGAVFLASLSTGIGYLYMIATLPLSNKFVAKGEVLQRKQFRGEDISYKFTGAFAPQKKIVDMAEYALVKGGYLELTRVDGIRETVGLIIKVEEKQDALNTMAEAVQVYKDRALGKEL